MAPTTKVSAWGDKIRLLCPASFAAFATKPSEVGAGVTDWRNLTPQIRRTVEGALRLAPWSRIIEVYNNLWLRQQATTWLF